MSDDPNQVMFHVMKSLDTQARAIIDIQKSMSQLQIDIAIMKASGVMPCEPEDIKKARIKDGATGGGVAAVILAVILGIFEYIKKHS